MRIIVAGSRTFTDYEVVAGILDRVFGPDWATTKFGDSTEVLTEVVVGGARGVDTLADRWAREHDIPLKRFPADWNSYGKAAGMIRNRQMAEYAAQSTDGPGALVAIWDGISLGTRHMIQTAKANGLLVEVHRPEEKP